MWGIHIPLTDTALRNMSFKQGRTCPICFKEQLFYLSDHLRQAHQLSSEERKPWLRSAVFSPTPLNDVPSFRGIPRYTRHAQVPSPSMEDVRVPMTESSPCPTPRRPVNRKGKHKKTRVNRPAKKQALVQRQAKGRGSLNKRAKTNQSTTRQPQKQSRYQSIRDMAQELRNVEDKESTSEYEQSHYENQQRDSYDQSYSENEQNCYEDEQIDCDEQSYSEEESDSEGDLTQDQNDELARQRAGFNFGGRQRQGFGPCSAR